MNNSKGPIFAVIEYGLALGTKHRMTLSLNFPAGYEGVSALTPGQNFEVTNRNGDPVMVHTAMQAIFTVIRKQLPADLGINGYSIYGLTEPNGIPVYLFGGGVDFALVTPYPVSHVDVQTVMSFRTLKGGRMRFTTLDGPLEADDAMNAQAIYDNGALQAVPLYMFSPDCVVVGRDGAFAATLVRAVSKQNDVLRRKRMSSL